MPKNNENIRLPLVGPLKPSESQGFTPDQMIRCDECLRINPPTRISCLYCNVPLPHSETSARLRKPVLRPPEKHELGYNTIALPDSKQFSADAIAEAAELLKLRNDDLERIVAAGVPLPLARTASREEAQVVLERLQELGFRIVTLSDQELGSTIKRLRSLEAPWPNIVLIVAGRLVVQRVEIKEARNRRAGENEVLEASEFFSDETVIDLYIAGREETWRVSANGFDFSCLESEKTLIANENIARLQRSLISTTMARLDDSYNRLRPLLDLVWSPEQETQSSGWRRERPGKLSFGTATITSNETQFTRYSRLLFYLTSHELR